VTVDSTEQFVTTTSVLTFGGASLLVVIVSTAIHRLTGRVWIAVPFVLSVLTAFMIAGSSNQLATPLQWLVTVGNAALLFCTATGANQLATERPAGQTRPHGLVKGKLFVSWLS